MAALTLFLPPETEEYCYIAISEVEYMLSMLEELVTHAAHDADAHASVRELLLESLERANKNIRAIADVPFGTPLGAVLPPRPTKPASNDLCLDPPMRGVGRI
jgi:hypothetical protein